MKIKELLTFDEYFPLMEMLNTRFDSIEWGLDSSGADIGIAEIGKTKVRLILAPIRVEDKNGINLSFQVWDGNKFSELFGAIKTNEAARLIGAVTNAVKDRTQKYNWDFVAIVAKDNIDARMRLYQRITERLGREQLIDRYEAEQNGAKFIIVSQSLSKEQIKEICDRSFKIVK